MAESAGTGHYVVEKRLAQLGVPADWVAHAEFLALSTIVTASDMIATVPEPLAAAFVQVMDIAILPHPIRVSESRGQTVLG